MAKKEVVEKYTAKIQPDQAQSTPKYAGLVESVDDSVGRVLKKLAELNLEDRTVIVFTSDNGGLVLNRVTSNVPLRAGKGSTYEGGVRVVSLIKWPGVTKPGSIIETPIISVDYFPTLLELAGVKPPAGKIIDGESLVPLLKGTGSLKRDTLYWHYPHYHPGGATPYSAIREGDWKLIEFFEDNHVELYNLKDDLSEQTDLAAKEVTRVAKLKTKINDWRQAVGAQLPSPNPDYDPNFKLKRAQNQRALEKSKGE